MIRFTERYYKQSIPQWIDCYINYRHLKLIVKLMKDCVGQQENIQYLIKESSQNQRSKSEKLLMDRTPGGMRNIQQDFQRFRQLGDKCNQIFMVVYQNQINLFIYFVQLKFQQINCRYHKSKVFLKMFAKDDETLRNQILVPFVQFLFVQSAFLNLMVHSNIDAEQKILEKHSLYSNGMYMTPEPRIPHVINIKQYNQKERKIEKYYKHEVSFRSNRYDRYRIKQLASFRQSKPQQLLVVGILFGMIIGQIIYLSIILENINSLIQLDPVFARDFPIWRGIVFIIAYMWILGVNVYFYQKFKINHRVILENNYTFYLTTTKAFAIAGIFSFMFVVLFTLYSMSIYNYLDLGSFAPQLLPIFILGGFILLFFNPLNFIQYKVRGYVFSLFLKIIASLVISITFPIIWGTDQLTSLIIPFQDIVYTGCYYSHLNISNGKTTLTTNCTQPAKLAGFIYTMVVLSYRIIQCLKVGFCQGPYWKKSQFYNSIKYLMSLITAVLSHIWKSSNSSSVLPAWIVFAIATTLLSLLWDIRNDWNLLHIHCQHVLLRDRIIYPKALYFICIFFDIVFRFTWVLYISPDISKSFFSSIDLFILLFGFLEILRRGLWNLLRVQLQHLRNIGVLRSLPKKYERLEQQIDKYLANVKQMANMQSLQRLPTNESQLNKLRQFDQQQIKKKQQQVKKAVKLKLQTQRKQRKLISVEQQKNSQIEKDKIY